ncbi:uncharacterized protein EDB91DRAFT_1344152 [Suillus paluster]|uniref:uncharacterized protein n=1 Tax=Suillus paluster TaxID=48578 RepID=UPI001B86C449|nr:uncharacterized protein EDB91DRAFT_1344152 [Suillus paluster]KAG1750500.1 hypothetical protein EDB91DRAFT_1344152 [Suillus paluster]
MATKSEDDNKSVSAPPATSMSALFQCRRPSSVFSFPRSKPDHTSTLSRIRDIVSAPDFMPSPVVQNVNACAAALTATDFSDILQTPNIKGHTALYWAIVNHHSDAFVAFYRWISQFSSVCTSDMRLACMTTSNHELFTALNLGRVVNPKDESLRRFLGCPSDEIDVHDEGDGLCKNKFVACLRIRMFQKRLRITEEDVYSCGNFT